MLFRLNYKDIWAVLLWKYSTQEFRPEGHKIERQILEEA
jgi:hypothetical protein